MWYPARARPRTGRLPPVATGQRIAVTMACQECKRRNYQTMKSKRNTPDRDRVPEILPMVRTPHAAQGDPVATLRPGGPHAKGRSSTGRAPVSKTGGWGFESLRPCRPRQPDTLMARIRPAKSQDRDGRRRDAHPPAPAGARAPKPRRGREARQTRAPRRPRRATAPAGEGRHGHQGRPGRAAGPGSSARSSPSSARSAGPRARAPPVHGGGHRLRGRRRRLPGRAGRDLPAFRRRDLLGHECSTGTSSTPTRATRTRSRPTWSTGSSRSGSASKVRQVVIPTEQIVETKDGKKVQTEKRVLPGYVLVNMDLTPTRLVAGQEHPRGDRLRGRRRRASPCR